MADVREERKAQAKKHLGLMRGAFSGDTKKTVEACVMYEDGTMRTPELPEAPFETTETIVTTKFASEVLREATGKTLIVDPTAFTRPGGAYEEGAFGPEQILCAESNLYPILQGIKPVYHDKNRMYTTGMLFTDRAAYLPNVVFSSQGALSYADILAIAEPQKIAPSKITAQKLKRTRHLWIVSQRCSTLQLQMRLRRSLLGHLVLAATDIPPMK